MCARDAWREGFGIGSLCPPIWPDACCVPVLQQQQQQQQNLPPAAAALFILSCDHQAPLDKVSAKLPWNKDREELQKMKMQKKVLDALTPLQRKKPETIRHGHRQAIAARAGVVSVKRCVDSSEKSDPSSEQDLNRFATTAGVGRKRQSLRGRD